MTITPFAITKMITKLHYLVNEGTIWQVTQFSLKINTALIWQNVSIVKQHFFIQHKLFSYIKRDTTLLQRYAPGLNTDVTFLLSDVTFVQRNITFLHSGVIIVHTDLSHLNDVASFQTKCHILIQTDVTFKDNDATFLQTDVTVLHTNGIFLHKDISYSYIMTTYLFT